MGNRLVLALTTLILLPSCSAFKKHFTSISWECGIENEADSEAHYAKIVKPDGQDLSPEELETTRGRFLVANTEAQTLTASPKGCFQLPKSAGIFQVYTLQGLQVSMHLPAPTTRIQTLSLRPTAPGEAELVCPSQGYFVNEQLDFPIRVTGSATLETSRIRLVARHSVSGQETDLFVKDYGETLPGSMKALTTAALKDGNYELRLEAMAINRAWDASVLPLNGHALCSLAVLHTIPGVGGDLELGGSAKSFYKQGDVMNWVVNGPFSELRVCREARGHDEDELTDDDQVTCQAKSVCKNEAAFPSTQLLRADEAGVFDYFYFAENRAGLKSDVQCKRVVVADQKPQLNISWQEADWNRPLAVMKYPRPTIAAQVSVHHSQYADAAMQRQLQCKLDFLVDGSATLPGKDAVCLAGRCAGQSLEQYVPCDVNFRASLQGFWKEQRAHAVLMRLFVKATDGAGQATEKVKSVWIHPQRWQPEAGPLMPGFAPMPGEAGVYRTADGGLYAQSNNSLIQWDDSSRSWSGVELPFPAQTFPRMIRGFDGHMYLGGTNFNPDDPNTTLSEIYERVGAGWKALPSQLNLGTCVFGYSLPHPGGGFLCVNDFGYLLYEKDNWSQKAWPTLADGSSCNSGTVAIQNDGTVIRSCGNGGVWKHGSDGVWKALSTELQHVISLESDQRGRVWVEQSVTDSTFNTHNEVGYFLNDQWTPTKVPKITQDYQYGLKRSSSGSILFYDYIWDDQQGKWRRLEGLDELSPALNYRPIPVGPGQYLLSDKNQLLLWDAGEITEYPLSWYGIETKDSDINPASVLVEKGRDLWLLSNERIGERGSRPLLIPFHKSSTFGPEVNLYNRKNESRSYNFWFEESGDLTLLITDRGLVRSQDEGWKTVWDPKSQNISNGFRTKNNFYVLDSAQVLRYREGSKSAEIFADNGSYSFASLDAGHTLVSNSYSLKGWMLTDAGEQSIQFPPEQNSMSPVFAKFGNQFLVEYGYQDSVFYRYNDQTFSWDRTDLQELGIPASAHLPRFKTELRSPIAFYGLDYDLMLKDLKSGESRPFVLPEDCSMDMLTKIIEVGTDDFLLLSPSFGIYRGDGRSWKTIVTYDELGTRLKLEDRTYFHDMKLDRNNRLWVAGEYFRLISIDL